MQSHRCNRCNPWLVVAGLAFTTLLPSAGYSQDTDSLRALVPNDYNRLRGLQDIQASPDGKQVLLRIGVVDTVKDEYTSDLWMLDPARGDLRQLTFGEGSEYHARFSPDGRRIAFIASRGENAQVHVLPLDGGEAAPLFTFEGDVDEFEWFPDGSKVAFIAKDPEPEDSAKAREQAVAYTRTYYKVNASGFLDNRYSHLWVADLATGESRRIGGGPYDFAAPSVSPDGRLIAFVSNRTEDRDENRNSDVFVTPSDSGGLIQVSREPGSADQPRWSPDGRTLAYLEQIIPNNYGGHSYLWTAAVRTSGPIPGFAAPRNLTFDMDRAVTEGSYTEGGYPYPRWSRDSRTIYIAIEDRARVHAYAINAASGARRMLMGGDRMVEFVTPVEAGLVMGIADPTHLSDVYLTSSTGANRRPLTRLNDSWFRQVRVLPSERLVIRSPDSTEVEGFVVKPAGFEPGRTYPTVMAIHGGPQWYYPISYHMQAQIAAGRGYLVVYLNPRGSTTYGHQFMALVGGRYAHADDQDFMTAIDTLVARGWADPDNLFLMGNSYGGIATNWLITQTDRFRAAASSSGVSDYTASFGVDDDHIEWLADMGGAPWQVPEKYRDQSPMTHIARVTTPTIFLHGALDHICPVGESERMYLALKLRGIDTRLVIFPEENHNFDARASSYPLRTTMILDWFDQHRMR
jgi:dipeptidyl aminopeptidase/acylaminoacyl peptidase